MRCPATVPRAKIFQVIILHIRIISVETSKPTIAPFTVSLAGMIIHMVETDTTTIRGTQKMALGAELSFCVALQEQEKQH